MTSASAYTPFDFTLYGKTATNEKDKNHGYCSYCQTELGRVLGKNEDEKLQKIISVRSLAKVYGNAYLNGNAGKGKEVEFQEANQHLVELVHCLVIGRQESRSQQCRTY